jgi:hypothetical protein
MGDESAYASRGCTGVFAAERESVCGVVGGRVQQLGMRNARRNEGEV